MIHLQNVTFRREDRQILKGIDLDVRPGENWILLGRNGCGKTTILEMVTAYQFPTSGTIDVLGNRYGRCDVREVRKRIGYISPNLIEKLTIQDPVWEIVAGGLFGFLRFYEEIPPGVKEQAIGMLDRVGLPAVGELPFITLSQGERKKVLLARTLIAEPELLILDEPCAGLDLFERERFLDSLARMATPGMAMLYVTHHIEEIVPFFSHVALMKDGSLIARGPKREVLTPDLLRQAYDLPVAVEWHDGRPWIRVAGKGE